MLPRNPARTISIAGILAIIAMILTVGCASRSLANVPRDSVPDRRWRVENLERRDPTDRHLHILHVLANCSGESVRDPPPIWMVADSIYDLSGNRTDAIYSETLGAMIIEQPLWLYPVTIASVSLVYLFRGQPPNRARSRCGIALMPEA